MSIDRIVLAFAGTVILVSLLLSHLHSPYWLLLTTFVGLNLVHWVLPAGDGSQIGGRAPGRGVSLTLFASTGRSTA